ncbi:MAG: 3-deoxy-D-manno-octulosonic acid transferase [Sulfitobacter sp.]
MSAPLIYRIWSLASRALLPIAAARQMKKLAQAGVSADRAREKLGHASTDPQSDGPLIWFHAASVGESLSVLALITRMGAALPDAEFLITSGTATSADLIGRRLPPRCTHQFAPLDAPAPLTRFLKHWRPDAAIFVESELWPQMLRRTYETGACMALVNARLSKRSRARWQKMPQTTRYMLDVFDLILTQNKAMAGHMVALGAPEDRVQRGRNLKALAGPLPVDETLKTQASTALNGRPVWIASSTHAGEEETVLAAHAKLVERWPDLCLILAPRHPERGDAVAELIELAGLSASRRSLGDMPHAQVYLADTMGELGTWYDLSDIVFLGGSLLPIGGHNPFEVAQSGALVLSGPHVGNFSETYDTMLDAGAAHFTQDASALADAVTILFEDDAIRAAACAAAAQFAAAQTDKLDEIAARLITALELE